MTAKEYVAAAMARERLYGVHGWLKCFVIMCIYVGPCQYVFTCIVTLLAMLSAAHQYPAFIAVSIIELSGSGILMLAGMRVGIQLRDMELRAVQNAKRWVLVVLCWNLLTIPLTFLTGLENDVKVATAAKTGLLSLVAFFIWNTYFNVSKRVRATYPDWHG